MKTKITNAKDTRADTPVETPAPSRFMLSNARGACVPNFCQVESSGGAKCVGFCGRCGSDMAIKAAGGAPTRPA